MTLNRRQRQRAFVLFLQYLPQMPVLVAMDKALQQVRRECGSRG